MEPFYFGKQRHLYGLYHPPRHGGSDTAVVLCYPLMNEYVRSHRAYMYLANELANAGVHAFRFDYYGTGDSFGDLTEASIPFWLDNIQEAVAEIRDGSGAKKIYLAGVRFGATLAACASYVAGVDGIILWHGMVSGSAYVQELAQTHRHWVDGSFARVKHPNERIGYVISTTLQDEISSLDIFNVQFRADLNMLILDRPLQTEKLKTVLGKGFTRAEFLVGENKSFWVKNKNTDQNNLLPLSDIKTIVAFVK